jgi:hypothetical protein
MRNHSQDDFDGGRAASLTTQEAPDNVARDLRRRWMGASDQVDLALALAMLALTEGSEL